MVSRFGSGNLWERVSEVLKEHYDINLRPSVCRRVFFRIYYEKEDLKKTSAGSNTEANRNGEQSLYSDINSDVSENIEDDDISDTGYGELDGH
jgi:hypothetical protein